jgi:hypothetical protein
MTVVKISETETTVVGTFEVAVIVSVEAGWVMVEADCMTVTVVTAPVQAAEELDELDVVELEELVLLEVEAAADVLVVDETVTEVPPQTMFSETGRGVA